MFNVAAHGYTLTYTNLMLQNLIELCCEQNTPCCDLVTKVSRLSKERKVSTRGSCKCPSDDLMNINVCCTPIFWVKIMAIQRDSITQSINQVTSIGWKKVFLSYAQRQMMMTNEFVQERNSS